MKTSKWIALAMAALMAIAMVGCNTPIENDPEATPAPTGAPAIDTTPAPAEPVEGETIKPNLTVGVQLDLDMLDPQNSTQTVSTRMQPLFYETLITWNPENGYQPCLAESWKWESDTELVFKLRQGVLFHNGEELKSSDVKFSVERVMEVARHASRYLMIQEIVCDDDYTVRFVTDGPNDKLVAMLSRVQYGAAIMNEKFVTEVGEDISKSVCGTGPYKLQSWVAGETLIAERNEQYWGEPGASETITFRVMSEDTSRVIALETGEIDIAETLPSTDVERVQSTDGLAAYEKESVAITYWDFNTAKEDSPFNNALVREAMNYAVDRNAVMKAVGGSCIYMTVLSSGMEGYDANVGSQFTYDEEKAKSLLAEAGYADGFTATLYVKSSDSQTTMAATVIQAYAANVGVTIDIISLESTAMMAELKDGEHDSYILTASNVDSYTGFIFFYSQTAPSGGNRMFYSNPEMDELYEKLPTISDPAERQTILTRMQEIAVADCAWCPLYGQSFYVGASENVKGILLDSLGFHNYSYAYVTE